MVTRYNCDFNLKDFLFESVKLPKNADPDQYVYSGYGVGFDSCTECSIPDVSVGKNAVFVGVDMHPPVHIDFKKNHRPMMKLNIQLIFQNQTELWKQ